MKIETAINFMLYTLMEVTLNDLDKKGNPVGERYYIEKAVRRAYRDASSHVLSIKEGKNDPKKNPYIKNNAISDVVDAVTDISNYNDYECWHKHVCKDILTEGIYKEGKVDYKGNDREFAYGIAQKFVNMTIKYLVVLYTVMKAVDTDRVNRNYIEFYEKNLKKYEQDFHVPIDGYILEGVWNPDENHEFNLDDKEKIIECVITEGKKYSGKFSSDKVKAWSKWGEHNYESFQKELDKIIKKVGEPPLDWESETWIKIAKSRKEK